MTTIAAIATPPGEGGIGIIRISGPGASKILHTSFAPHSQCFKDFVPWKLHRGWALNLQNEHVDDCLAVFMPGPNTFTGEDVAEIHCHGGRLLLEAVMETVIRHGARPAERGEFTRRAFINGRIDLTQAEAVAELISAPSKEAALYGLKRLEGYLGIKVREIKEKLDELRTLVFIGVDFPDDEVPAISVDELRKRASALVEDIKILLKGAARNNRMQTGATVMLAGAVNAGKSSILNAFLGSDRALVTNQPGTTRDFLEVKIDFDGMPARLIDCAGFRDVVDADRIERLGMEKSRELLDRADLILIVVDSSLLKPENGPDSSTKEIISAVNGKPALLVFNKNDIFHISELPAGWPGLPYCSISAITGNNFDHLASKIRELLLDNDFPAPDNGVAPNMRQALALEDAAAQLLAVARESAYGEYDCALTRLDSAASSLDDLLGLSSHDELLNKIFSRFCIGK